MTSGDGDNQVARRPGATPAVRVPATSANLGPGFDAFGVALDLHLTVAIVPRAADRVTAVGEGAGELPTGDDNLVWRAFSEACRRFAVEAPDASLRAENAIPLERGLGSSAAAAVAGAALARAVGGRASDQDLIDVAADLEGHPDNAAAAVLGGLVACLDGQAVRLDPSDHLRPVVCVPTGRQSTEAARAILPESVSLTDAAANGARAALVLAGLAGLAPLDPRAMTDVLHEPPRFEAMPETGRLVRTLREQGWAACLSGAGPSVLVVIEEGEPGAADEVARVAGSGFRVVARRWDRSGAVALLSAEGAA